MVKWFDPQSEGNVTVGTEEEWKECVEVQLNTDAVNAVEVCVHCLTEYKPPVHETIVAENDTSILLIDHESFVAHGCTKQISAQPGSTLCRPQMGCSTRTKITAFPCTLLITLTSPSFH
eukprot:TRINITY_DN29757_c0_g1_i1.p1 TRINITY_DN29757_c0_g1~~TRINITY_DN29757_c0_g1_i1.p1  ORF type:complete len:119 (+),score=1.68 TRINITY_DN29757_c0_g1_i1:145-501(+)